VRGSALLSLAASLAATLLFAGCAARGFVVPTGAGTVEPTLAQAYQASIASCGDLRSLTADIKLSGRVDGRRVRGTLQVGLTRDGGVRIEAVAPFGAPIFTIAGRADAGTLWLPRSQEVVRAAPAEILEALTGVALPASGLFEIVTACPAADDAVVKAERFTKPDLARVSLRSGAEVWWQPGVSPLHPLGARRAGALVEYRAFAGDRPQTVRLGAVPGTTGTTVASRADLTLTLQQVESNVALGDEAFTLPVPDGAKALTLAELRQAGVLR
jgi:outer membrane biogenesis lipoprotein LolB